MEMTLLELDQKAKYHYSRLELQEAMMCYAQAFTEYPNLGLAYNNYGNIMRELGYPERAYGFLQTAIDISDEDRIAPFNLSIAYLIAGDLKKGWEQFETRWRFKNHEHTLNWTTQPRWEGQDLTDKILLVTCEEGDGDNIQFIRFVNQLRGTIIIQTEPQLKKLFKESFKHLVIDNTEPIPHFDYWVPILSLPRILNVTYGNLISKTPYLKPNKKSINEWKKRMDNGKIRVGVSWRGRTKNYPFEYLFKLMRENSNYEWVNLQALCTVDEINQLQSIGVKDYFSNITNWHDTAGLVSNLDVVITIDTGLAHLVGALNKPCLMLLDRYKTCWRWLLNRNDSPWYPSLTLIRQTQIHGYDEQLTNVQNHIAKKIGAEAPISST